MKIKSTLFWINFAVIILSCQLCAAVNTDGTSQLTQFEINTKLHQRAVEMFQLSGKPKQPNTVPVPGPDVGDQRDFWAWYHQGASGWTTVPATCRSAGVHCYVFVEDAIWHEAGGTVTPDKVENVREYFDEKTPDTSIDPLNGIYQIVTDNFGPTPDSIDADPKIYIFLLEIGGDVQGYFDATNQYPSSEHEHSNEVEMVYVDGTDDTTANRRLAILSHEFQHMIHWNMDANETTWIDEGCASFAYMLCGYGQDYWVAMFAENPDNNLTKWESGADYPQTYLFIMYIYENYGGKDSILALVAEQENGLEGVENMFTTRHYGDRFTDLYTDWVIANELDNPDVPDGEYHYDNSDLEPYPMARVATVDEYPFELSGETVNRWAVDYLEFTQFSDLDIVFDGGDDAHFVISAISFLNDQVKLIQRLTIKPDDQTARLQIANTTADRVVLAVSVQDTVMPPSQTPYSVSATDGSQADETPPFVWIHRPWGTQVDCQTDLLEIILMDNDNISQTELLVQVNGISIDPIIDPDYTEPGVRVTAMLPGGWVPETAYTVQVDCADLSGNTMNTFTYYFYTAIDAVPPHIYAAGYWDTNLTTAGGQLQILAFSPDMDLVTLELGYAGDPIGLMLTDDGTANDGGVDDGLWGLALDLGEMPAGNYLLELYASDKGDNSSSWPQLDITAGDERSHAASEIILPWWAYSDHYFNSSDSAPVVMLAGYWDSDLTTSGGKLNITAFVSDPENDIAAVQLFAGGLPTGVLLRDDGLEGDLMAGDGLYTLVIQIDESLPEGKLLLEIGAEDFDGNMSALWPYLNVK